MDNLLIYILISVLTLACLGLSAWLIYIKLFVRYTREKYAFFALSAFTTLVILAFTTAFYQTPWTAIMQIIAHYSEIPSPQFDELNGSDKVLIFTFVSWIAWLIQRTFSQWNGEISVNQAEQQKRHEEVLFISEGIRMLLGKYEEKDLQLHNKADYKQPSALEVLSDSLAWRMQAIELLTLRWHGYYRFEAETDENWHEKANCWLGKNVKQNKTVAVFCCRQEPNKIEIQAFIDYVRSLGNELNVCELLIITQYGNGKKTHSFETGIQIEEYCEMWLLDGLVDFEDYFSDLKKRVEFDCLPDSELKLPDIYVPSALRTEDNQTIDEDLEAYLKNWLSEAGQRQIAVLGEYGQGKSTGTLMFSYHLIKQYNGNPPRIPILLELRGKSPKTLQPLELLSVWSSNFRIDPKALMKLQQAGRLLLIFEGFDEMAEVSDSEARFNHFRSLWRFCYPKSKVLITGRPNFFLDDRELKALLGVDNSTATGAYVQALHLQPFSQIQIEVSLRNTNMLNRQEICQLAAQDIKFYDIVARPSLLYIVNQLWDKSELRTRRQDVNSALVIGLFIQHSYKRQTAKVNDGRQFMVLNEAERSYFMDGIAAYMAKEKLPNQITLQQFNQIVEQLYAMIPEDVSFQVNAFSTNPSKPLKMRLQDNDDPLDAVKTDVRTCGILVKDITRANALKFPHKSFLEYLFANYCVQRLMYKNNAGTAAIWKVTQATSINLLNMLESLEFAGELLHYVSPIHENYYNKQKLQSAIFEKLITDRIFNSTFHRKIRIIGRLTKCMTDNFTKQISRLVFGLVVISFSGLIAEYFHIGVSFPDVFGIISPYIIVKRGDFLYYAGAFVTAWLYVLLALMMNSRKDKRISLWFLLSVISRVSDKKMCVIYGKNISNILPELAKEFNAEYILEKYNYYTDD